ncbi:MAG: hypothetical protein ACRCYU_06325 [Nocardioides sp.]
MSWPSLPDPDETAVSALAGDAVRASFAEPSLRARLLAEIAGYTDQFAIHAR